MMRVMLKIMAEHKCMSKTYSSKLDTSNALLGTKASMNHAQQPIHNPSHMTLGNGHLKPDMRHDLLDM